MEVEGSQSCRDDRYDRWRASYVLNHACRDDRGTGDIKSESIS